MNTHPHPFTALLGPGEDVADYRSLGAPVGTTHRLPVLLHHQPPGTEDALGFVTHLTGHHGLLLAHGYTRWPAARFRDVYAPRPVYGNGGPHGARRVNALHIGPNTTPASPYARLEVGNAHTYPHLAADARQIRHRYRALRVGMRILPGDAPWPVELNTDSTPPTPAEETALGLFAHYWLAEHAPTPLALRAALAHPHTSTAPRLELHRHGADSWTVRTPGTAASAHQPLEDALTSVNPQWKLYRDHGLPAL